MPEIIEIEQYREAASAALERVVAAVDAPDDWYLKDGLTQDHVGDVLVGVHFVAARRRGKLLLLDGEGNDGAAGLTLGLRFGMTGRLIIDGQTPIDRLEYSSDRDDPAWDRFTVIFADGGRLAMRDPRRLGGVELDPDESRLGIDALTVDAESLTRVLGSSVAALKTRLMDQARLAGLGNLLTDEICWRAGLDPGREAGSLAEVEVSALGTLIPSVIRDLAGRGGSHTGDLQPERHRDGVCPADGTPLQRRTIGGRTTYSCPTHQR